MAKSCEWVTLQQALTDFVNAREGHQGAGHIKPLHWYVACRLVLEGGFRPDDITPRPPFRIESSGKRGPRLVYDSTAAGSGERTILGGLKTKTVDTVVVQDGIGPCIALSLKGTLNAFRNLTNRMEEAVGDCTNLHITYPALVYGFLHVVRATREGPLPTESPTFLLPGSDGHIRRNDIAVRQDGNLSESLARYHDVLVRLCGRADLRDDPTRYESVALVFADYEPGREGMVLENFPSADSPLHFDRFFASVYRQYDLRFDYGAPALSNTTRRLVWDPHSPAFKDERAADYAVRVE